RPGERPRRPAQATQVPPGRGAHPAQGAGQLPRRPDCRVTEGGQPVRDDSTRFQGANPMRRSYLMAGGVVVVALACVVALTRFSSAENRTDSKESSKSPTAAQLPIGQVVLFSS